MGNLIDNECLTWDRLDTAINVHRLDVICGTLIMYDTIIQLFIVYTVDSNGYISALCRTAMLCLHNAIYCRSHVSADISRVKHVVSLLCMNVLNDLLSTVDSIARISAYPAR